MRYDELYEAPKPEPKSWAKIIALRFFALPILLLDFVTWGMNKLFGGLISKLMLPAQEKVALYEDEEDYEYYRECHERIGEIINSKEPLLSGKKIQIKTHDNALLDTFEIQNKENENLPIHKQRYIINFMGNMGMFEGNILQMEDYAKDLCCNVIGFNYRGVEKSNSKKPKSKDDLVTDGIAQVQRLLQKGVKPENIILKGYSLGGGIATLVAKYFHGHGEKIYLFNSRSFSNITNVVVGWLRSKIFTETGHREVFIGKVIGWIAKPFIKLGLVLTNWEIDAAPAYLKLPKEYKQYMFVRSSKQDRKDIKDLRDDTTVTQYASLDRALKDQRDVEKKILNSYVCIGENLGEAQEVVKHARERIKEQLKARKMIALDSKEEDGHILSEEELISQDGKTTPYKLFSDFFRRSYEHEYQGYECNNAENNIENHFKYL